jgi:hypothetical protein
MLSRRAAVRKLRQLVARKYPWVTKFTVVARPVRLTHYGVVAAVWDGGRRAVELPEPYQLPSR